MYMGKRKAGFGRGTEVKEGLYLEGRTPNDSLSARFICYANFERPFPTKIADLKL